MMQPIVTKTLKLMLTEMCYIPKNTKVILFNGPLIDLNTWWYDFWSVMEYGDIFQFYWCSS